MASIYRRGNKIYARFKDRTGAWISESTRFVVGQEDAATKYVTKLQAAFDKSRSEPAGAAPLTVRAYVARWIEDRDQRGVASAATDGARLAKFALPHVGDLLLSDVRTHHVRDMVRAIRSLSGDDKLAPRSVIHVFRTLHNVFDCAIVDELIAVNPAKLKRGELPKKIDADPEWRSRATFTVREVEQLISDPRIPPERRVTYALKAIAGLRHGEAASICWRHLDRTAEPLARANIVQSFDSATGEVKSTKTGETRAVPIHPTLAKIFAAWRLEHWHRVYGRQPTDDDYVVPARTMRPVSVADAGEAFKRDLRALGLRVEAGERRDRGGHDLRSWYKTRCIEDGADSLIVRRTTHAAPKDVDSGYERFSWAAICREVGKLRVTVLDGKVLELATEFATAESKSGNRWTKQVTPLGLEGNNMTDPVRSSAVTSGNFNGAVVQIDTRCSKIVASLATSLAAAVLAGDFSRARELATEIQSLCAGDTARKTG